MKIFPDVITTSYIISQVLGFISLIIFCAGYFCKKDKLILTQLLGNIVVLASYILLNATAGWVGEIVCIIRCLIFYLYERKNKKVPVYVFCLTILSLVACVTFTWSGYYDLFILSTYIIFTFSFYVKNELAVKILIIFGLIFGIIYSIVIFNVLGYIRNGVEILIDGAAVISILIKRKKKKIG